MSECRAGARSAPKASYGEIQTPEMLFVSPPDRLRA